MHAIEQSIERTSAYGSDDVTGIIATQLAEVASEWREV